jgi:formate dehydrogenase gamma subunit
MNNKENIIIKSNGDVKYLRMTVNERIQHIALFTSFIVLILTGFGLKFPEAFWVRWIVYIIGEHAFELRGLVHRIAAVVMIAVSVYHIYYVLFIPRGKELLRDFLPRKQDITDFKDSMFFLLGKSKTKPKLGRFSYIEKMEYWAVVWGTVIMTVTGGILWFKDFFFKYVGISGMIISTAIHYYEAILASFAILVWHFYFVFLNPDVFPMNKAWIKGYLTKEQMEHEHPLWLEEIEKTNSENNIDDKEVLSNKINEAVQEKAENSDTKSTSKTAELNKPISNKSNDSNSESDSISNNANKE